MSYRDRETALLARIHALEKELEEARKGEGQHERWREENRSLKHTVAALSHELNRFRPRPLPHHGDGAIYLLICDPDGQRREQKLPGDKTFTIGTLGSADVQLRDAKASREHAIVETVIRGDTIIYREIISKHGNVVVNRRKSKRQSIDHGDIVELGDTVIVFGL